MDLLDGRSRSVSPDRCCRVRSVRPGVSYSSQDLPCATAQDPSAGVGRESGLLNLSVATVPSWPVSCVCCALLGVCMAAPHIMLRTCFVLLRHAGVRRVDVVIPIVISLQSGCSLYRL